MERYRRSPGRILLLLVYFTVLAWVFSRMKAVVLTVDAVALLEIREREFRKVRGGAGALVLPAVYLFGGFLLVFAYNDIIASARFPFGFDAAFNSMDRWILHGSSVSDLSRWAQRILPLNGFRFLEFIYFGMFPQIGAAILLLGLYYGKSRSLQFVGTILTAYYLALGMFYLWPSQGPYYLSRADSTPMERSLWVHGIQQVLTEHALALWRHVPIQRLSTDYFIAFPCMHIAQPLIVAWFLRKWKAMTVLLVMYDFLLIVAILLLQWHYLVDILAGILVAGMALAVNAGHGESSVKSADFA